MFTAAALALVVLLAVAIGSSLVGAAEARVAAIQVSSGLAVVLLVVLSRAVGADAFVHLALVTALASVVGGLAFARFLEHWL